MDFAKDIEEFEEESTEDQIFMNSDEKEYGVGISGNTCPTLKVDLSECSFEKVKVQ